MDRVGQLLVNQQLCESRNRAQRLIKQAKVRYRLLDSDDWSTTTKPSLKPPAEVKISVELGYWLLHGRVF